MYNLDCAIPGYAILNSAFFELCILNRLAIVNSVILNTVFLNKVAIVNSVIFDIMDCQALSCLVSRLP